MEIELYAKLQNPIDAIDNMGRWFARSAMFGCHNEESGKVMAMACVVEHKSPIQLAREYHLIDGRLTDRADSMLAKFRAQAGGKYRVIERTPDRAAVELTDKDGEKRTFSLTFEEVKQEPFVMMTDGKGLKKNWRTPRARMQTLWARVVSDGVRTMAPEIVCGIYTPEELDEAGPSSAVPPAALNMTAPAATEPKPANVAKVETVVPATPPAPATVTDDQAEAAMGLAPAKLAEPTPPAATTTPEPKAFQSGPHLSSPPPATGVKLSPELVEEVQNAIGEHAIAAANWMLRENWLRPGQHLEDLPEVKAKRIIRQKESFLRAILNQQ